MFWSTTERTYDGGP